MKASDFKEARPQLLRVGLALAVTAGIAFSHYKSKRLFSSFGASPKLTKPSQGNGKVGLQCANDAEKTTDEASPAPHENFEEESLRTSDTDFETSFINIGNSPRKDEETHQAIIQLRDKVRELQDRETKLERELLGYYGFKEQQTAFMELQNRLKISSVEAKLFNLKIESLQADNKRMEAQLVEYCRVVDELESAKAKIKMLKRKIRSDEEQNKEEISSLQQMLKRVEDKETNYNADTLAKLDRLRELEDEEMQLRRENAILQLENSELARNLESTQILASSVLEVPEVEELQEANNQLRQDNESLMQQIEELQESRCADVEELVYLRWLNACLRYELKGFQPSAGKTTARDLSKSVSPRSKEKAKELILEYASIEDARDSGVSIMDIDSEYSSSSQNSNNIDSSLDDSSSEVPSTLKSNVRKKFVSKLKKLVLRKNSHHHSNLNSPTMETNAADSNASARSSTSLLDDDGTHSLDRYSTALPPSSRHSLDAQTLRNMRLEETKDDQPGRRNSDVGSNFSSKRFAARRGVSNDFTHVNAPDREEDSPEKQML
ncbi:hypothetical protein Scep_008156 [Stephania cephalantha]|uniref:Protein CHUP1, chloroplastic n=1 Tax=Stephania cephalantha TaxID=152367 RepID=A0AAP0KD31_9MAGN